MDDRIIDPSALNREPHVEPADAEESKEVKAQEALLHDVDPSLASADEVAEALNVDTHTGLSSEEAKRRLEKFGANELASAPPVPKWKKFLQQFQDPLVYLLLAATAISLVAWIIEKVNAAPGAEGGEALPFDAIVIVLILIVNAVLGYVQEAKADEAVNALSEMTAPTSNVLRNGRVERIATRCRPMAVCSPPPACASPRRHSPANRCRWARSRKRLRRPRHWATARTWCSTARP